MTALVAALEAMGADLYGEHGSPATIRSTGRERAGPTRSVRPTSGTKREADGLFDGGQRLLIHGRGGDLVELGLAIAWEKPVFLTIPGRLSPLQSDSEAYPLNAEMLFTGLPEMGWEGLLVQLAAQEIANPD